MIQSVLCLMMVLHGGFANPVASEGGAGSGLDLLASIGEAFFPLVSSIVSDEIDESQNKIGDENELEHGQWYNMETVTSLGVAWHVKNDNMCCEKCKELYGETEFFGLTYRTTSFNTTLRDCICMKSKPGVQASTHAKGKVTGQCGIQAYNGKGGLGDGRTFLRGSTDYLGVITNVDDAASCCGSCMAMGKFPATQLFEFTKENKQCHCHKPKIDDVPETKAIDYSIGTCPAIEVTEAAIEADASKTEDGVSPVDSGVSDAVISEEVDGTLGDGKIFDPNTVNQIAGYPFGTFDECCSKCGANNPEARFFVFSKAGEWCACFTPIEGVKPASILPAPIMKGTFPSPVTGVCAAEKSAEEAVVSSTTPPATKGPVTEEIVSPVENSESNALPGSDNTPKAAALTVPDSQPELCDGDFSCCPHPTDGDNTLGTEQFIQESQYKSDFSSCSDACKKLYPYSNGVTQSKTQTYKSNKLPFCWCEFGQYKFQASTGYQTCLFKPEEVVEDDYDY